MQIASHLHFEDEAAVIELNQKMKRLKKECAATTEVRPESSSDTTCTTGDDLKQVATSHETYLEVSMNSSPSQAVILDEASLSLDGAAASNNGSKILELVEATLPIESKVQPVVNVDATATRDSEIDQMEDMKVDPLRDIKDTERAILKYEWIESQQETKARKYLNGSVVANYGILLATFVDAETAADGNVDKAQSILTACKNGGGFVDDFYYQYKVCFMVLEIILRTKD
jgi:hypothetical protein